MPLRKPMQNIKPMSKLRQVCKFIVFSKGVAKMQLLFDIMREESVKKILKAFLKSRYNVKRLETRD